MKVGIKSVDIAMELAGSGEILKAAKKPAKATP